MGAPCSKEEAYRRAAPLVRRLVEKYEARVAEERKAETEAKKAS